MTINESILAHLKCDRIYNPLHGIRLLYYCDCQQLYERKILYMGPENLRKDHLAHMSAVKGMIFCISFNNSCKLCTIPYIMNISTYRSLWHNKYEQNYIICIQYYKIYIYLPLKWPELLSIVCKHDERSN